ncbi:unnamed protein product [Dovyalis caffra]|uniref:Cytochrome c biogenesis B n=1 Tax=Dovyalis caffra TaxID=77055 RepID=A0AAV1SIP7_9ROSI|nr:unnamed protein product [Dovyalis caffra]
MSLRVLFGRVTTDWFSGFRSSCVLSSYSSKFLGRIGFPGPRPCSFKGCAFVWASFRPIEFHHSPPPWLRHDWSKLFGLASAFGLYYSMPGRFLSTYSGPVVGLLACIGGLGLRWPRLRRLDVSGSPWPTCCLVLNPIGLHRARSTAVFSPLFIYLLMEAGPSFLSRDGGVWLVGGGVRPGVGPPGHSLSARLGTAASSIPIVSSS